MNRENFFQYDLYTLERKYPEFEFIELLNSINSLSKSIEAFIDDVTNLLYDSIVEGKIIEIKDIVLPNIADEFEKCLSNNPLYKSYKSISKKSLTEIVVRKFLQRLFSKDGCNDEKHIIQDYTHSWLEIKLAQHIVHDSRFCTIDLLKSLIDKTEMLFSFYHELVENIPINWVLEKKHEWVEVKVKPENILDSIRTYDKDYLDYYVNSLKNQSQENPWDNVKEISRSSNYISLNSEFSFISSVLIRLDISLWIEFWDNLNLPIIQDCVFHGFNFKPKQYVQLVAELVKEETIVKSDLKILLLIVAQNYFDSSFKLSERLSLYEEQDRRNDKNKYLFDEVTELQKDWIDEKKINYEIIIKSLKKKLSDSDIEDWIFSYKPRNNSRHYKSNALYNSEIELLSETYKKATIELLNSNMQKFNFQKFNFYVEVLRDKGDRTFASTLLDAIIGFVSSNKFFWDKTYAEPYWSALKGLGFILSMQDTPIQKAKELIDKFKSNHQGWNPIKIEYSLIMKESFIYSGISLMFENESAFTKESGKEEFFKFLVDHILVQNRYSQIDNSKYYQIPLHILFLVANQIFSDVKEYYERELIDNYDDLYSLLSIITSDKEPILDNSKTLINNRLDNEFLLLKKQYSNRKQKDKVQELEKMIGILNTENKNSR